MRYFIHDSETAVEQVLTGICSFTDVPLQRVGTHLAVVYPENGNRKVKIVVGGGSGHEPLFLGIAGPGLADGAVAGQVFAAPAPDAIYAAIEAVRAAEGVILMYGNYSGDVFNFAVAADDARANGIQVAEVRIHDDIASSEASQLEERRGIAGDIFVIKAGEIHSFKVLGDSPLIQLDVHLSPRFIQENL